MDHHCRSVPLEPGYSTTIQKQGSIRLNSFRGPAPAQVIWFESEETRALIGELLESNFKKFINDVQINGGTIRLK
jgi:hypothetical protein